MIEQEGQTATSSVFISYSRVDKEFVRKLNDSLDSSGVDAWVDWEGIPLSSDWMEEITHAIEGGDAFLFVISPDSLSSKVCMEELELGLKYNKKLVPILYREPEKGSEMHEKLAATNWVYMRGQDDFDATLPKLIESIQTDLGWVRQHTRLLQRAVEWDEKERDNSFLLQGADLQDAERWMTEASAQEDRDVVSLQAEYISASRTGAARRQRTVMIGISLALVVSIALGIVALFQWNRAVRETNIAKARLSASEARNYQSQSGELDLSTLLAIDSLQRFRDFPAEDILRRNTSLIPIPLREMKHGDQVQNVQVDPDGRNFITSSSDKTACVYSFDDGSQRFCVQLEGIVYEAVFSKDGDSIFTGDEAGNLRIWDANTGFPQKEYSFDTPIWDLSESPNGNWLAVARDDKTASIINLANPNQPIYDINTTAVVYVVTFSPDGEWLAIGDAGGKVALWNVSSKKIQEAATHNDEVYVAKFSPDSKLLATGGADSTVRVTEVSNGTEKFILTHGDWVEDIAFSPDGNWFAVASDDNRVYVWDTETGQEKMRMRHDNYVLKVRVSQDGRWISSASFDRTVRIWDASSGSQMMQIPLADEGSALAFNSVSTRIAVGDKKGNLSLWDTSYLQTRLSSIESPEIIHEAIFSASDEWLIANTDERLVWQFPGDLILNMDSTEQGSSVITAEALTYDLDISQDTKWVVAGERENDRAILRNLENGTSTLLNHGAKVYGVAFSPDSTLVTTAGSDGKIVAWNVSTGEREFEFDNSTTAYTVDFRPASTHLATGLDNRTIIWDVETQTQVIELLQAGEISVVTYSDDSKWLATGSSDGTIYVWNAQEDYASDPLVLRLNGQTLALDFSPDDRWLAAGGSSNFAYLWDLSIGEEVSRLPHSQSVTSVSFSQDGNLLATVSRKVIQLWDVPALPLVPTGELINVACTHLTANMSDSEWSLIFPEEEYRPICPDLAASGD